MINQEEGIMSLVVLDLKRQDVKRRITITGEPDGADAAARQADKKDKEVIFKNCAPFINFKSEIHNTEIDNAKDTNIVMPMYNLIKYSDNYSKTIGNLW